MRLSTILFAVPKRKRSLQVRWRRKYGDDNWPQGQGAKLLKPKRHTLICGHCGEYHLASTICSHCYSRVKSESQVVIESIRKAQGLDIVDKEVAMKYQSDSNIDSKYWQGKRIVEIDKPRPEWFSPTQLQPEAGPSLPSLTSPSENTTPKVTITTKDNK